MKLLISGSVPSQKNRKKVYINRATGKPFIASAPEVKQWRKHAVFELQQQFKGLKVTGFPIGVSIVLYYDSKRRKDLDNSLASIMDALTTAEILPDDSVEYVDSINVSYGGVDKDNPRAEIFLDD